MKTRNLLAIATLAATAALALPAAAKEKSALVVPGGPAYVAPPGYVVTPGYMPPPEKPRKHKYRISSSQVRHILRSAGYHRIHDVDFDDGRWEAEAINPAGYRVKLRLPPDGSAIYEKPDWDGDDDDDDDDD